MEYTDIHGRTFYHGTKADLKAGDTLQGGYSSNYTDRRSPWIYFSEMVFAATWGAELARGEGPGRIYVVDPQVFSLFDVICRDMHAQSFDERSITLLYLTAKDTAVDARVTRLGKSPFKLGRQTVMAEELRIKDPWSEFHAWVSPTGRMLRLTLPSLGLRVDRDPATLKPGRTLQSETPPPIGLPQVLMASDPRRAISPDSLAKLLPPKR